MLTFVCSQMVQARKVTRTWDMMLSRAFALGLREVGSGDAQAQLVLLKEVVGDISDALSKSNFSDSFFVSIKHLMSDHCYTEKND